MCSEGGVQVSMEAVKGGKEETLDCDVLLVCIGRRAYTDSLGLEVRGVAAGTVGRLTGQLVCCRQWALTWTARGEWRLTSTSRPHSQSECSSSLSCLSRLSATCWLRTIFCQHFCGHTHLSSHCEWVTRGVSSLAVCMRLGTASTGPCWHTRLKTRASSAWRAWWEGRGTLTTTLSLQSSIHIQ